MKTSTGRGGGLERERLNNRPKRSHITKLVRRAPGPRMGSTDFPRSYPSLSLFLSLSLLDHLQKESSLVGLGKNSKSLKDIKKIGNLSASFPFFLSRYSVF